MALHPDFPDSPHVILNPDIRWFPADEALRESSYEKLLPPLVHDLRKKVKAWRDNGYEGTAYTSVALLNWWFNREHMLPQSNSTMVKFQYYFALALPRIPRSIWGLLSAKLTTLMNWWCSMMKRTISTTAAWHGSSPLRIYTTG